MHKAKAFLVGLSVLVLTLTGAVAGDPSSAPAQTTAPEATTYQIRNVKYGELLRPRDANNAEGTPIVLYPAQPWKCMTWQLKPRNDSDATTFRVKNLFTSKTFHAVPDPDTNAPQQRVAQFRFPIDGTPAPAWRFVRQDDGSYEIADVQSGHAVTAVKDDDVSEARIVTAIWSNQESQKWRLEKIDPKDLTM